MPGQLGGKSGLPGTKWVSATGEVAGDPELEGFSRSAVERRKIKDSHQSDKTNLSLVNKDGQNVSDSPCSLSCNDRICSVCFRLAVFRCWFSCSICNKDKTKTLSRPALDQRRP